MKIQNELDQLSKILEKIKAKMEVLDSKIEKREDTFNDRSEAWQESDKGVEYDEETTMLRDMYDECDDAVTDMEYQIERLSEIQD